MRHHVHIKHELYHAIRMYITIYPYDVLYVTDILRTLIPESQTGFSLWQNHTFALL